MSESRPEQKPDDRFPAKRPAPIFRIHDSTPVFCQVPGQEAWTAFRIARKTGNSIFIQTADGPLQLDRIALERVGRVKRQGTWYVLRCPQSRHLEERKIA